MYHRLHVRPGLVDRKVEQNLAGPFSLPGDLLALQIDRADVIGLEVSLADAGRRAEHAIGTDAIGMISLIPGAETLQPDAATDVAHLFFDLEFADADAGPFPLEPMPPYPFAFAMVHFSFPRPVLRERAGRGFSGQARCLETESSPNKPSPQPSPGVPGEGEEVHVSFSTTN